MRSPARVESLSYHYACYSITVGYHRLYSHKAFKASLGVRIVLALLGAAGFQGSIKVFSHSYIGAVLWHSLISLFTVVVRTIPAHSWIALKG